MDSTRPLHHSHTNVLLLTVCTLRADHLGAYGYPYDVSPFIDSLAEKGVLFERVLTAAPWTRPSIAAAITGLYPRTLNIDEPSARINNRGLHESFETLAEVLKERGYYTVGITANPNVNALFNFDQGFDYYEDTGDRMWRSGYSHRKRTAQSVVASLLKRLQSRERAGRKFFAHLILVDPHRPWLDAVIAGRYPQLTASLKGTLTRSYDSQIRYVDDAIAHLMKELDPLDREDTLVIVTSDHGEGFRRFHSDDTEHGLTLYNSAIWVPLIFYHPTLEDVSGRRTPLTDTTGLMPTLLDLLQIDHTPHENGGRSFKAMVYASSPDPPLSFSVTETCSKDVYKSALLRSGWKLINTYRPTDSYEDPPQVEKQELYRYEEDRNENQDLAAQELEQVRTMSELLHRWHAAHNLNIETRLLGADINSQTRDDLEALGYVE
jgi:arylsulfatase A-like enzyme